MCLCDDERTVSGVRRCVFRVAECPTCLNVEGLEGLGGRMALNPG